MWEKIVELILKKYLEGKTPRRRAAKAFVQLYNSMISCHEAYLNYANLKDDKSVREWRIAIQALSNNLLNLRFPLHIYDPDINSHILQYIQVEQSAHNYRTIEQQALDVEKRMAAGEIPDPMWASRSFERFIAESIRTKEDIIEFEKAANDLRLFIKNNFSLEDILDT